MCVCDHPNYTGEDNCVRLCAGLGLVVELTTIIIVSINWYQGLAPDFWFIGATIIAFVGDFIIQAFTGLHQLSPTTNEEFARLMALALSNSIASLFRVIAIILFNVQKRDAFNRSNDDTGDISLLLLFEIALNIGCAWVAWTNPRVMSILSAACFAPKTPESSAPPAPVNLNQLELGDLFCEHSGVVFIDSGDVMKVVGFFAPPCNLPGKGVWKNTMFACRLGKATTMLAQKPWQPIKENTYCLHGAPVKDAELCPNMPDISGIDNLKYYVHWKFSKQNDSTHTCEQLYLEQNALDGSNSDFDSGCWSPAAFKSLEYVNWDHGDNAQQQIQPTNPSVRTGINVTNGLYEHKDSAGIELSIV